MDLDSSVSILYLRCTAASSMTSQSTSGFVSILYLRCVNVKAREGLQGKLVSILYLRCAKKIKRPPVAGVIGFNSLFEMRDEEVFKQRDPRPGFNSLFEMRRRVTVGQCYTASAPVSILYLRCARGETGPEPEERVVAFQFSI